MIQPTRSNSADHGRFYFASSRCGILLPTEARARSDVVAHGAYGLAVNSRLSKDLWCVHDVEGNSTASRRANNVSNHLAGIHHRCAGSKLHLGTISKVKGAKFRDWVGIQSPINGWLVTSTRVLQLQEIVLGHAKRVGKV